MRFSPARRRSCVIVVLSLLALLIAACDPTLGSDPVLPAPNTCASGGAPCCPTSATGVTYYGNLRYGHDVDFGEDLYLDAYLPAGSGPFPTVVAVHGGGHIAGDKCKLQDQAVYLAQHGFATFSINYPLASDTRHPWAQQPADARLAVRWVRAFAGTLHVDPAKIALWGTSAGADLALVAAYQAQRSDPGARVQAVAGWSGVYDFVTEYSRDPSNTAHVNDGLKYFGCLDLTNAWCFAAAQAAAPISYVAHDDPPTLVDVSTNTNTGCESVEPQNAVQIVEALHARGAPALLHTTSACAHAVGYWKAAADPPGSGTMIDDTIAFLRDQFNGTPSPRITPAPIPPPITGPSVVTPSSTCAPTAGSNVAYTANAVYGSDFGHPLYGDLYAPVPATGPVPAVVVVHGGGHVGGDKCDVGMAAVMLAQNGIAAFSVNYPLATASQPTFPNPVYDVMNAVAFLRSHASGYGIDPTRLGVWGGSAGGNLALSAALVAPLVQPGATVRAVVNWSGTADVFELAGEYAGSGVNVDSSSWAKYVGCTAPVTTVWSPTANACFVRFQEASPGLLVDPLGAPFAKGPAILVATSTQFNGQGTCEIVPPRQAQEVQQRAQYAGLFVQLDTNDVCAHAFGYLEQEFPSTLAFLKARLA